MKRLKIQGWNPGFGKIGFTKLIRDNFSFSLAQAKSMTDAVLAEKEITFEVADEEYDRLSAEVGRLGAVVIE